MSVNAGKGQSFEQAQVGFLSKIITSADRTVSLGWLPPNSVVIDAGASVNTAFNAGTNNHIDIGFSNSVQGLTADPNAYTQTPLAGQTVGNQKAGNLTGATTPHFSAPVEITAAYGPTGAAPTAGVAQVYVAYVYNSPFEE